MEKSGFGEKFHDQKIFFYVLVPLIIGSIISCVLCCVYMREENENGENRERETKRES